MSEPSELRRAYRTLNEPTRLLGLSIGAWLAVVSAAGAGYAWLMVSPLGWRVNISLVVIALGAPLALLVLREQTTISPGRLLLAILAWRLRPTAITGVQDLGEVRRGAVRLDTPAPSPGDAPSSETGGLGL